MSCTASRQWGHDALDRVTVDNAEVDDRGHIRGITLHAALPPWIIVGAMVVVTNGKRSASPCAGRDGVRVARNILHERFERLLRDIGRERFKRAGHGAVEAHGKRRARDVGDRTGETPK